MRDHDAAIWVLSWRPGYHSRGIAWTQSTLWSWLYRHQSQLSISTGQEWCSLAWPKVEKDMLLVSLQGVILLRITESLT